MSDTEDTGIDQELERLEKSCSELRQRCLDGSASRVALESAQLARRHERLIPYMTAQFHITNNAQGMLDPERGREAAIELIALVESEDRARQIQSDFPEGEYAATVAWMSACAYDNLAEHTAQLQGYNSEGMQSCISAGIQVCQRTGKLGCINCFRGYATSVFKQADDLDMALHYSRVVRQLAPGSPGSERRWVGAQDEAGLLLMQGNMEAAEEAAHRAVELAPTYHTTLHSRIHAALHLDEILLLAGKQPKHQSAAEARGDLPRGEYTSTDLLSDEVDALRATVAGDFPRATELLTHWDRWLTEHRCLHEWFKIRLRLIATYMLMGDRKRADALAKQLAEKAQPARDFLTLRRLQMLNGGELVSPAAVAGPLTSGPYAAARTSVSVDAPSIETPAAPVAPENTPLEAEIQGFIPRMADPSGAGELLADLLRIPPDRITHPFDAARLIHMTHYLGDQEGRGPEIWRWARSVADRFPQDAVVLSLFAMLGHILRQQPDSGVSEEPSEEQLERVFRSSLDIDPNNSRNFGRAAAFFLDAGNIDEAERCLARGFRLDRTDAFLAGRLATVYERSDRARDALAVLDLALREGCEDPDIAWQAVHVSYGLKNWEALLTYVQRFEAQRPGEGWANYFAAVAYLETGKPQQALEALAEEGRRRPESPFVVIPLRACAEAALGNVEAARRDLAAALAIRFADVDDFTVKGLTDLMTRVWTVVADWPADDPLRQQLERRLLAAGMAPDDVFQAIRDQGETAAEQILYRCLVLQPLDERWPQSEGCLLNQGDWKAYYVPWGILTTSESEAERLALEWQARCYPLPAKVLDTKVLDEGFVDKPGVVWQGVRAEYDAGEAEE